MRTEDDIRKVYSTIRAGLKSDLDARIGPSVFMDVIQNILDEKVRDRIYQVFRDWSLTELSVLFTVVANEEAGGEPGSIESVPVEEVAAAIQEEQPKKRRLKRSEMN